MRLTLNDDTYWRLERRAGTVRWARWLLLAATLAASMTVAACGGSASKGPLTIGVFVPFEGEQGFAGPYIEAECNAAVYQVNAAGGLLGHKVQCKPYDSSSDPADAVPVANRMLATASNLIFVAGPADQEPPIEPALNAAKMVHFSENALPLYDHQASRLFYRPYPSDSLSGAAVAVYLMKHGYTHAAAVFDNSPGSQNQVSNLVKGYPKLGGKLAINLKLAPGDTYRTEVARLLASNPDAIVTELATTQESTAFYSELVQLSGGKNLPPIVAAGGVLSKQWLKVVEHAIGAKPAARIVHIVPGGPLGAPGYRAFKNALLKAPEKIADRKQYLDTQWVAQGSDALVIGALAILEAKSTDSAKFAPLIKQIANGVPGAKTVHTYAQAAKEITAGHRIHYVGAGGTMLLNKWNNVVAPYQVARLKVEKDGLVEVPGGEILTPEQITKAIS